MLPDNGNADITETAWIVNMVEADNETSFHVTVQATSEQGAIIEAEEKLAHARSVMKGVAHARTLNEARRHADILPHNKDEAHPDHRNIHLTPEQLDALDRFWADPENEPSKEGRTALAILFARSPR